MKDKRGVLKPLLSRLHREFNLATAEIAHQEAWQTAQVALVTITNDAGCAHSVLERTVHWIESHHPEVEVVDWQIEIL